MSWLSHLQARYTSDLHSSQHLRLERQVFDGKLGYRANLGFPEGEVRNWLRVADTPRIPVEDKVIAAKMRSTRPIPGSNFYLRGQIGKRSLDLLGRGGTLAAPAAKPRSSYRFPSAPNTYPDSARIITVSAEDVGHEAKVPAKAHGGHPYHPSIAISIKVSGSISPVATR